MTEYGLGWLFPHSPSTTYFRSKLSITLDLRGKGGIRWSDYPTNIRFRFLFLAAIRVRQFRLREFRLWKFSIGKPQWGEWLMVFNVSYSIRDLYKSSPHSFTLNMHIQCERMRAALVQIPDTVGDIEHHQPLSPLRFTNWKFPQSEFS